MTASSPPPTYWRPSGRCSRSASRPFLSDLEQREPELLALLTEQASELHRRLGLLHIPFKTQRRLTRQIERLGLHLVLSLQSAQRRLWSDGDDAERRPPP